MTEKSIAEVARLTGLTSRTLRHYDAIGLLAPSRIAAHGYRRYDDAELVRLQRILLLRELGLPLAEIGRVLDREVDDVRALSDHLGWLESERSRIDSQLASVRATIQALREGGTVSADTMFDGFDHSVHRAEVEQRWGEPAFATGDAWWRALTDEQKRAFRQEQSDIARDFGWSRREGLAADSDQVQAICARHVAWLSGVPGTPRDSGLPAREYVIGLGEMYAADPRFGKNYDRYAEGTSELVRDALRLYAEANL